MRFSIPLTLITCLSLVSFHARCQGCSDAGFCTMGAMKPDQPYNKKIDLKLRSMEISFYRGTTPLSPVIYVATADMNFGINSKTFVQLKVPWLSSSGTLGKTSGLSDLSLCFTRTIVTADKYNISFSAGAKIPTNKSDLEEDGRPLPMYYQTSLGTYDLIAGISFINRNWLFATGIQHPFNHNENKFTWSAWSDFPDQAYVMKYAPAYELRRGTDVMLRIERNFRYSRFNFTLGLLPIYRLNHDQRTNPATGEIIKPEEAKGLALSAIATAGYSFNVQNGVRLLFGHKITNRDVNPDGLTREMVTTVSYYYRF